eukprot:5687255-Amphidinium_carterae.1
MQACGQHAQEAARGLDETLALRAALTVLDDAAAKVAQFDVRQGHAGASVSRPKAPPPPGMIHREKISEQLKERQKTHPPKWVLTAAAVGPDSRSLHRHAAVQADEG